MPKSKKKYTLKDKQGACQNKRWKRTPKNDERKHKDYQEFINLLQLMNNLKRPEQITRVERILTKH